MRCAPSHVALTIVTHSYRQQPTWLTHRGDPLVNTAQRCSKGQALARQPAHPDT